MSQRNVLVFECAGFGIPEWHDTSEGVRVAEVVAKAIAAALNDAASDRGHPVSASEVSAHGSYGWEFDAIHNLTRVRCLVQRSDAWLLITEPRRPLLDRLRKRPFETDHARVCAALDLAVRSLPGASQLEWTTLEAFRGAARRGRVRD
jgi:hypothetical protein